MNKKKYLILNFNLINNCYKIIKKIYLFNKRYFYKNIVKIINIKQIYIYIYFNAI